MKGPLIHLFSLNTMAIKEIIDSLAPSSSYKFFIDYVEIKGQGLLISII